MVTKPFLLLVPCAPTTIQVTTVVYQNNSVHDVELFWTHREVKLYNILTNHQEIMLQSTQSCSVPQYTVRFTTSMSDEVLQVDDPHCTNSSCFYVHSIADDSVRFLELSIACINALNQTGQPYVTIQSRFFVLH